MGGVIARIDLDALEHNVGVARTLAPGSRMLAVIKANAYGHGIAAVAQRLASEQAGTALVDGLAVARVEEGVALRESGIELPIVVLGGFQTADELTEVRRHQLQSVVHSERQCALIERGTGPVDVWLKLDTGMHRLGLTSDEFVRVLKSPPANMRIRCTMSHLGYAMDKSDVRSEAQIAAFLCAVEGITLPRSMVNSAGLVAFADAHLEWTRPGIMLYGISPFSSGAYAPLRPVMTVSAPVIAIREVRAGDEVGYGGRWRAARDTRVAVLAAGYGDGYPAGLPDGTPVLIEGERCGLVGVVAMDMVCCEIGLTSNVGIGSTATLWGEGLAVEDVALGAGLIAYALPTGLTGRVQYVYH